jgi:hypothetical protein
MEDDERELVARSGREVHLESSDRKGKSWKQPEEKGVFHNDIKLPGGGGPNEEYPECTVECDEAVDPRAEQKEVSLSLELIERDSSEELSPSYRTAKGGGWKRESSSEAEDTSQSSGPREPVITCGGGSAGGRTTLRETSKAEKCRMAASSR